VKYSGRTEGEPAPFKMTCSPNDEIFTEGLRGTITCKYSTNSTYPKITVSARVGTGKKEPLSHIIIAYTFLNYNKDEDIIIFKDNNLHNVHVNNMVVLNKKELQEFITHYLKERNYIHKNVHINGNVIFINTFLNRKNILLKLLRVFMNIVETMSTFVEMEVASFHAGQWSLSKLQKKGIPSWYYSKKERSESRKNQDRFTQYCQ
jgi:hypothetical protein